ncbi:AAA family ATPase [Shinella sp. BYT-45]|uniref:AAA family ATPase n=1 Tax=Shinella sp. BYT-45 TaxID=3377377 RepID=UPI00398000E0
MTASNRTQLSFLTPQYVASRIGGKVVRGNRVVAHAPGHKKGAPEISITVDPSAPRGILVNCFSGEDSVAIKDWILRQCGEPDFAPGQRSGEPTAHMGILKSKDTRKAFYDGHLIRRGYALKAEYDYATPDGEVLFQVLRYEHGTESKTFMQRQPDGSGGWLSGRPDPIIYRWPEIASRPGESVYVVEGEKDADNLIAAGLLATTAPNGSWPLDLSPLRGRTVYVIPDNDAPGAEKAEKVIALLHSVATVKRVELPGLPDKGDVTDWLEAGHTAEQLQELCRSAPPVPANDNKPTRALSIFDWTADRFVGVAPPVEYLVEGVIPMGVPGMVSAAGDTGKSYALLELHRRIAFGSTKLASPIFGGKVVSEGTSVMITSEDDANEVHRRIAALDDKEQRYTAAGKRMIIVPLPSAGGARAFWREDRKSGLLETDDFRSICDQLLSIPDLRLVTFDPLASFAHLPLNEDPTAGQFVCSSLARLASETKATVLVAHHMRKSKTPIETLSDAREAIRGSTALVDGLRLAYAMWPADEARAKRVCKSLGIGHEPNKIVLGGVVKANGAARRMMSIYARNETGLLIDRSAGLGAAAPAQGDLRAALVVSVEAAAAAGAPFTKTGASGLFELRERLPEELRRLGKARLDALASDALERGEIVRAAARGEKTAKWLDVPTGMFAAGIGTFTAGMPR